MQSEFDVLLHPPFYLQYYVCGKCQSRCLQILPSCQVRCCQWFGAGQRGVMLLSGLWLHE